MVSAGVRFAHAPVTSEMESNELQNLTLCDTTAQVAARVNDCDVVLDSIDDCVGCVEGIDIQHRFEEGLREQAIQQRKIAAEHGLSEAEATIIRLQMIDGETISKAGETISKAGETISKAVQSTLPELDIINTICGNDDILDEQTCGGLVSPTDTTLATSLPGNKLVESRVKSARSLVDVAEDEVNESLSNCNASVQVESAKYCAVCSDEESARKPGSQKPTTLCRLPCCDANEEGGGIPRNIHVCIACMLVLTSATSDGASRVGRCLRCRSWLSIETRHSPNVVTSIRKLDVGGQCEGCMQTKDTLVEQDPPTCDACFVAKTASLLYECEECHQMQSIGQPLYRCQPNSTSFGNEMWACNRCQKSSHWRIGYDQLALIPANDIPLEWGDDFLEIARDRVQTARRGIAKLDLRGRDADGRMKEECTIL
jgi:hypothetical protein